MTKTQKRILVAVTILVAFSRWWAMSATLWDWDEALFASAVRSFDVVAHHPHPPGFPLYVLLGKVVDLLAGDEFRSMQLINLVGASSLFPALFFLGQEMGFSFATSVGGSLICVFAPSVWFFGGTAFSDVPSLTLVVTACALLLRSRRGGPRLFLIGALVLGIAAGFRPQNLVIGFFPLVLAAGEKLRRKDWRAVAAGVLLIAAIAAGSYVGAGLASSSWADYQWTLDAHREYIVRKDMVGSSERPPLRHLADDFFLREFQFFRVSVAIFALSILSAASVFLRRRRPPLLALLTFGPFALFALLVLDYHSVNRFSMGYLPMFAILAADGIGNLAAILFRREQLREAAVAAGSVTIALAMIVWAVPAIGEARTSASPPIAAARWIRANLPPSTTTLYVTNAIFRIAEYLLPEYQMIRVTDERSVAVRPGASANAYVLAEGATEEPSGFNFMRSRKSRLWRIARKRYFEISIIPLARRAQFLEGWHEAENIGAETWRWMERRSLTVLAPQSPPAQLRLTVSAPLDVIPVPIISVKFNGKEIDRFSGSSPQNLRVYAIDDSRSDAPNELLIETDQWVNPKERGISGDARELGLRLQSMSWGPAPSAGSGHR